MNRLPLVIYPDAMLKTRCDEITEIDQELVDLAGNMSETMYGSQGIGLAAPQVGQNVRLITVDVEQEDDRRGLMQLLNPVVVEGHGWVTSEEGCLSFPGLSVEVRRREQVHLQGFDLEGREVDLEADGLLAICLQHEIDHLNGVTFLDRLSPVRKKLIRRNYLKMREEQKRREEERAAEVVHGS